ncbi:MAG: hypothetical protein ACLFTK_16235, partial [Anaerolineales bacterium]
LSDNTYQIFSRWYGDVRLVQYGVLAPPPTEPQTPLDDIRFGEHITLIGYSITGDLRAAHRAGSVIGVTLYWTTDAALDTRYKVFVQLLGPDGRLIAQHDSEPANNRAFTTDWTPGELVIDSHGIRVPPGLAPGDYTLITGLYDGENPTARLPVRENDHLILERVNIQ